MKYQNLKHYLTGAFIGVLFAFVTVFSLASAASAQTIPQENYQSVLEGDPAAIHTPIYTYRGVIKQVYDSDTLNIDIDLGFNFWRRDINVRLARTNAYEIKRSRSKKFRGRPIDTEHVAQGFKCRDLMISWLGGNPTLYPRKVMYHELVPRDGDLENIQKIPMDWLKYGGSEVVIQTLADESGKFGRPLVIVWKNGHNLNQWLVRSGCADLNWYDGKSYPVTSPITPR